MMNNKIKKDWLKALRSGEYKQGQDYLCSVGNKFCCLGVLMDIEADGDWELMDGDSAWSFKVDGISDRDGASMHMPNRSFHTRIGLTTNHARSLADKNDAGYSFEEIADLIEEKL
tara:strand:- start:366 stop:710 length:345 start_codon:yes stop_codon:yes gene_type:complete